MTSSVTPCTMNIVESVTTIGCSLRKAMKRPLKAPTAMPTPIPASVHTTIDASGFVGLMLVANTTLTSESTAPAERSKPPTRMTRVSPNAAIASAAPPLARKLTSK